MAESETHYTLPSPRFSEPTRLLIVVAPYYRDIADQLITGAKAAIKAAGATHELVEVPGALEVPTAIRFAANSRDFDGFVAHGCVIRGQTTHYETVCNDSSRALQLLGLDGVALGNGILTVENRAQAEIRANALGQNKGGGAAEAAMHLILLARKFNRATKGIGFRPASENILIADSGE